MKKIFLDHAATTPTDLRVVEAMLPYFSDSFGNPSSIHSLGLETRTAVAEAREKVASLIGAAGDEIIFTSGGTEADNLAIKGIAQANAQRGKHIVTTRIEHHAVEESCRYLEKQGFKVTHVAVDQDGLVDPREVERAVTPETILISVMHANNEVGTIQPIAEISRVARSRGIYFHTDAVQTVGHIPAKVDDLGVDLLAISAHKLYGPKGVGVLYVRKGTRIVPFMHGGGQERGLRATTENVPGIVGFGKAAEIAQAEMDAESKHVTRLRDKLIKGLLERIPQVRLNGHPTQRLPNNVNISVASVEGESLAVSLDLEGIAVSTGSACSSEAMEPSHVLTAMGVPVELARGSLRFSLGKKNTDEEIDRVLEAFPRIVSRLRAVSPLWTGKA
ncbi:MAG TPA: cysteine desulfurase NifS [Dehalococcoidia bacterium]|nr:cysteine desulfurase NifS [Dehalococcoidia bacterium]